MVPEMVPEVSSAYAGTAPPRGTPADKHRARRRVIARDRARGMRWDVIEASSV
jgi:hypothetical protein